MAHIRRIAQGIVTLTIVALVALGVGLQANAATLEAGYTAVSISCNAISLPLPNISYKGYGVNYPPNRKIFIEITVYNSIVSSGPAITEETTLYTSGTGSWSTPTYTHYEVIGGTWTAYINVTDANTGELLGSGEDGCLLI